MVWNSGLLLHPEEWLVWHFQRMWRYFRRSRQTWMRFKVRSVICYWPYVQINQKNICYEIRILFPSSNTVLGLDWTLVSEKRECNGPEIWAGKLKSLEDCATACRGIASMFIYGTTDFGTKRCDSEGCNCVCETPARSGACEEVDHKGYRLYKYTTIFKGNKKFLNIESWVKHR